MDKCCDPCMTVNEAIQEARANGISISDDSMIRMVTGGHVPFGWGCPAEPGKKSLVYISTYLFRKWLGEYLGHEPIEVSRI